MSALSKFATGDLHRLLSDIDRQPEWRSQASRCADYYDSKQMTPQIISALEERGQPAMCHNLVAPAVDGVLGMEAKTRQGVMVRADDEDGVEVAEAINEKVNEMSRLLEVDRACSDAFAAQTKTGLAWVEVNRAAPGEDYPYQVNYIHRDEIWHDWQSKHPSLKDARWLLRKRWLDEDEAVAYMPQHEDLIRNCCGGWLNFSFDLEQRARPALAGAYEQYESYDWNDTELFDTERRRIRIYEIWYRKFEKGYMLHLHESGKEVRYDENNNFHRVLITNGYAKLVSRPIKKMFRTLFIGPHQISDELSPLPHNNFPYTPFFGYREDSTGIPYGIIRRMLSPQDEYNFRRNKLTYLLNYKRTIMDDDATEMGDQEVIDEVHSAEGLIKLNKNRKNRDSKAFWVETDSGIIQQQFTVMQDAKQQIQDAAGIYSAMLGQQSNATSGVAINGLIEQGNTTLAELFDNFRYARKHVFEQVMAFAIADINRQPAQVKVNQHTSDKTKVVYLNERVHEGGIETIKNDVLKARMHVVLDDITNTPGYRAQLTDRMLSLIQTLPPQMQAALLDLVIESTDMPKKEDVLKRIRKMTGQGVDLDELTPEEREQLEAQQRKQAAIEQLELAEITKKIGNLEADILRKHAAAAKDEALVASQSKKDDQVEAQTLKILAEIRQMAQSLEGSAFVRSGHQIGMNLKPQHVAA